MARSHCVARYRGRFMVRVGSSVCVLVTVSACGYGLKRYEAPEKPNACPAPEEPDPRPCGAISGFESGLHASQVFVAADTAAVVDKDDSTQSDVIGTVTGGLRLSKGRLSAYGASTVVSYGIYPAQEPMGGPYDNTNWGNHQFGVAWRYSDIPTTTGSHRRAFVLRGDVSHGTHAREDEAILARRPFALMQLEPGWNHQLVAEGRYELVGCYAPFIHAQVGFMRIDSERRAFPATLTVGMRQTESLTLLAEYGVMARTVAGEDVTSSSRMRLGLEWDWFARLSAAFELNLGAIDGVFFALGMAVPFEVTR